MIIVGAYPRSFAADQADPLPPIRRVDAVLADLAPARTALHLLPFYPSDGDGGFAPNDWFSVAPEFGDLTDIAAVARHRPLIVDGIYNHVGINHRWCRQFFHGEGGDHRLRVLKEGELPTALSPRGWPVIHRYLVGGVPRLVWQTFSRESVDLDLSDAEVIEEVDRHLDMLVALGVHGVRLDAPAYYGKPVDHPQRHSAESVRFFRRIAAMCARRRLAVLAQLNCDEAGGSYTVPGPPPFLQDYALPALMAAAVLDSTITELVRHLRGTWSSARVVRPLRTHDGILLRTGSSEDHRLLAIAQVCQAYGIPVRQINGQPYEVNSSFPRICSVGADPRQEQDAISLALTLLLLIPGSPYIYLPILFGWRPETAAPARGTGDPRSVNRIPISRERAALAEESGFLDRVRDTLGRLAALRADLELDQAYEDDFVRELEPGIVVIGRRSRLTAVLNFRRAESWEGRAPCASAGHQRVSVGPRGAALCVHDDVLNGAA